LYLDSHSEWTEDNDYLRAYLNPEPIKNNARNSISVKDLPKEDNVDINMHITIPAAKKLSIAFIQKLTK
jgi:hypothetical protein